ncbi:MAG: ABC transporter ATP-binding protein [Methanoregula sp.]|jgi:iron(III) transport system ATP-binding protein|nr:ABC transporter ATP-binding protein [Methanoregula sp.]
MIELKNISKTFDSYRAVDKVTLTIPDHAQVVLLGPSGSGKTTLLRLIAGLEVPDTGTITMDGRLMSSPDTMVPPSERSVGFVFQSGALWPHMTVADNIQFALGDLTPGGQQQRTRALMERMGILTLAGRYPDQISGGEARRVALARALAPRPATLLFDEPLTNLDRTLREDLLLLIIESVREAGSRMLYVTHDEYEAERIDGTVIRFDKGAICRDGI